MGQFFAPTPHDLVDGLIGQYQRMRGQIKHVAEIFAGDLGAVVPFFIYGNEKGDAYRMTIERLFLEPKAVAALDSSFWKQALALTDVYNCMPQPRRDEWDNAIREHKTPEFTEDNVRATLGDLLMARGKFFAERVDGIFRALSRSHVTNTPEGFNRRMILEYVFNTWGGAEHSRAGTINDLRCVIAKFMGRDEPRWGVSLRDLERCRSYGTGEWHVLDGGALRIRVYKKGTAHLEIHPEMAWRLNAVLHTLYPHAIPSNQRTKPPKRFKTFAIMARPLPFAVLEIIREANIDRSNPRMLSWGYGDKDKTAFAEAKRVVAMIGGVETRHGMEFDYDVHEAINEILLSGCIPDRVSHQFYPTPEHIARAAVEAAQIGPCDICLEPSAGIGNLADFMPKGRIICIEISKLHCAVLRAKGYPEVEQADFLEWSKRPSSLCYERIIMNPPFSEGRAVAHMQAAFGLLAPGGRLVAILPASMRGKGVNGAQVSWSQVYENEFAGTSCAVAIATIERAA